MIGVSSAPVFEQLAGDDDEAEQIADAKRRGHAYTGGGRQRSGEMNGIMMLYEKVKIHKQRIFLFGGGAGTLFGIFGLYVLINGTSVGHELVCGPTENIKTVQKYSAETGNFVATNLGSWLCLEDWFFSGAVGRYVSTPAAMPRGQGACLPPNVPGPLPEPWPSEGILVKQLVDRSGKDFAIEAFKAHRESFVTNRDFQQLIQLGIRSVRIPIHWCIFADALAAVDADIYGKHDADTDTAILPDPYYKDEVFCATIPRKWFEQKIRDAAAAGLTVVLDVHTMPGGSSDGTYSGIWPLRPQFWQGNAKVGNGTVSLRSVGNLIAQKFIDWVETLDDLVDGGHIRGLCFMNEPAHMSFGKNWVNDQEDIIKFLDSYSHSFRQSSLPARKVRLYIQVIDTGFANWTRVPEWYHGSFSKEERFSWAVISLHFYTAWGGAQGSRIPGTGYQCEDDLEKIRGVLVGATRSFAQNFVSQFRGLRAVTEWSMGSHYDASLACKTDEVLRIIFQENVNAFAVLAHSETDRIEPFFWSWKLPYGPEFRQGWSLKDFSGFDREEGDYDTGGKCIVGSWARMNPLNETF